MNSELLRDVAVSSRAAFSRGRRGGFRFSQFTACGARPLVLPGRNHERPAVSSGGSLGCQGLLARVPAPRRRRSTTCPTRPFDQPGAGSTPVERSCQRHRGLRHGRCLSRTPSTSVCVRACVWIERIGFSSEYELMLVLEVKLPVKSGKPQIDWLWVSESVGVARDGFAYR